MLSLINDNECIWSQVTKLNLCLNDFPVHKLKLDAVYTSDIPFFDFDSQMDPWTVAREAGDSRLSTQPYHWVA